jgi:protein SCO1/2
MAMTGQIETIERPRSLPIWWKAALVVLGLALVGLLLFVTIQPIKVLPRMRLAPGISLIDSAGQPLSTFDTFGEVVLYNFTYTGCGEGCAETGTQGAALQERLRQMDLQGIPVRIVTISFDPARDTPERLASWLDAQGADPAWWNAATGDPAELKTMIGGGFESWYEEQPDGSFRFDPTWVLVDGAGFLRSRYAAADLTPAVLERDLGLVIDEAVNSTGVNKLVYEAAHQFLCYP